MNIPCPAIQRYRKSIEKEIEEIGAARRRMVENANQHGALQETLESVRGERIKKETRRTELEGASAVQLHRMNLTPEKAIKESESLQRQIETAVAEEAELSQQISQLAGATETDSSTIQRAIRPLINRCFTASKAELIALLNAMIDTDTAYQEEHTWQLFSKSFAHNIYQGRTRRLQHELWAVVDETLENPIVPLAQRPIELPEAQGSAVCREVHAG